MFTTPLLLALVSGVGGGGLAPAQTARLVTNNPQLDDEFGYAAAADGTVVVGAYRDDTNAGGVDSGSAHVFERDASGEWTRVAVLKASDAQPFDEFGCSVDVDGDLIVVGAHLEDTGAIVSTGAAYVFGRDQGGPGAWGEVTKLVEPLFQAQAEFGAAVAVDGKTILVGAPGSTEAHVFRRNVGGPGAWGHERMFSSGGPNSEYGAALALEDDLAFIALPNTFLLGGHFVGGKVDVWERINGSWTFVQTITSPGAQDFGDALAVSGGTLAIGASRTKVAHNDGQGSAHVFDRGSGGLWLEVATFSDPAGAAFDEFGVALDIAGDVLVVGAHRDDLASGAATDAGSAHWFERDQGGPNAWGRVAVLTAEDAAPDDRFGRSVAVSGGVASTTFVGAHLDDHTGVTQPGSAYAFEPSTPGESYCTAGVSASGCQALVSLAGVASASAPSGFDLLASTVEAGKDGLFFYGTSGRQANPWGNGSSYLCVLPPRRRSELLNGVGAPGSCLGTFVLDLNARWCAACPKPAHNPGPGGLVQAQLWHRDSQSTSNQKSTLSDAIEFCVSP
jgi:hypothetical protein